LQLVSSGQKGQPANSQSPKNQKGIWTQLDLELNMEKASLVQALGGFAFIAVIMIGGIVMARRNNKVSHPRVK
jgi:hypothetical protein